MGYYQKRRYEIAIEMLQNGEKIANISERLNFSTVSNFSLAFKKRLGVSPKKFVEELHGNAIRGRLGDPKFKEE
jgi:AraC-like DNA-binding protein